MKSRNCTSDDRQILFLLREIQVFLALKSIHQVNYSAICCNLIDFVLAKESNHVQCEKAKKIEFPDSYHLVIHARLLLTSERRKKECEKRTPNIWLHLCDDAVLFREIVFDYWIATIWCSFGKWLVMRGANFFCFFQGFHSFLQINNVCSRHKQVKQEDQRAVTICNKHPTISNLISLLHQPGTHNDRQNRSSKANSSWHDSRLSRWHAGRLRGCAVADRLRAISLLPSGSMRADLLEHRSGHHHPVVRASVSNLW